MVDKLLIVGISGVTCGGKTTVASELNKIFPRSKLLSQDDYFLDVNDPRHVWITELNHINFDILSSLDMEKMHQDIQEFIKNKILIDHYNDADKKFQKIQNISDLKILLCEKVKDANLQILIVEGFTIFNYKPLQSLFHLKYYFTLSKEECSKRRSHRVYEPPDCPGYFDVCVWPEYIKQLEEIRREVKGVKYFNEHTQNPLEEILIDIGAIMDEGKLAR